MVKGTSPITDPGRSAGGRSGRNSPGLAGGLGELFVLASFVQASNTRARTADIRQTQFATAEHDRK